MDEFALIRHFFQRAGRAPGVILGVGDDCAVLAPQSGMQLAVSSDMLVAGRHFFPDTGPERLGHKALAVNLSDLAACGARPLGFTLALALPRADVSWLQAFSSGLLRLADAHGCPLIGGDTTRGPLNITITVLGEVPAGQALLRSGARAGDDIWVSGHLGDARLALEALRGRIHLGAAALEAARARLEAPTPRVALGQALRGIASSAVDISDGLLGDLGHILAASGVGALVETRRVLGRMAARPHVPAQRWPDALGWALAGGDDYELCFTAARTQRRAVLAAGRCAGVRVSRIGQVQSAPGLHLLDGHGRIMEPVPWRAFQHFPPCAQTPRAEAGAKGGQEQRGEE